MINFTEDGYAAMLLTTVLSPDKDEYARPYSAAEFRALEAKARASRFGSVGGLLNADVSGLMIYLGLTEPQAIRLFTLLNRMIQLMYMLEGFERRGIQAVTCYDDAYPRRVLRKLGAAAPVSFFHCGPTELLDSRAVAILGMRGVRTSDAVRRAVAMLAERAAGQGYAVITSGEPGVSQVAAAALDACGGRLIEVLGGGMSERLEQDDMALRVATNRAAALSLAHPDALSTPHRAADRTRLMFSMSDAVFIFNTDGRRGEVEMLQNKVCDWVYAWAKRPENQPLVARGAIPFDDVSHWDFPTLSQQWQSSDSEQLSIFDMM